MDQQYHTSLLTSGNSIGIREPAAFLKAYPAFADAENRLSIVPISDYSALIRVECPSKEDNFDEHEDPILSSFLEFLAADLEKYPENIEPVDQKLLDEIASLTKGVKLDDGKK